MSPLTTLPSLPETTQVSLPGARRFCASLKEDDPRKPYAQLFIDALVLRQRDQTMHQGCSGREGFSTWEYCVPHVRLGSDYDVLRKRQEEADRQHWPHAERRGNFQVGSENWWRELGFDFPCSAKVVDGDFLDGHYVTATISMGLAREWIKSLPEKDRRRRFARLHEMFLQYQVDIQELGAGCQDTTEYSDTCCPKHLELAETWLTLHGYARRLQAEEERRPRDTWQDHPVLSQRWWEGLVLDWRDGAVVVP